MATAAAPTPATRQSDERPNGVSLPVGLHSSGAFGAINGSTDGADFLSVGARYRS